MRKILFCFAVGLMVANSFLVTGTTECEDDPITSNSGDEWIPEMIHIYIYYENPNIRQVHINDGEIIRTDNWTTGETHYVSIGWTVVNDWDLSDTFIFHYRLSEWQTGGVFQLLTYLSRGGNIDPEPDSPRLFKRGVIEINPYESYEGNMTVPFEIYTEAYTEIAMMLFHNLPYWEFAIAYASF